MGYNLPLIIGGIIGGFMLLIALQMLLPFPYGLLFGFVFYIIILVVCISKGKKIPSRISPPSDRVPQLKTQDSTQFWVCPNCGNDTQMKDERQYCPSCKIYLSI